MTMTFQNPNKITSTWNFGVTLEKIRQKKETFLSPMGEAEPYRDHFLKFSHLEVIEVKEGTCFFFTVNTNSLDPKLRLNQLRVRGNFNWQL